MCSWATTDADIDAVLSDAREIALTVSSAPGSPG